MNKRLLAFAIGVALTALVARAGEWGLRKQWEMEAWQHQAGFYEFSIYNDDITFKWYK